MTSGYLAANQQMGMEVRDVWSTAYVNDLPDSAFLYIAPGGTKTGGKTDGAHRYFPVKDADGKPDAAHIKNAMSRIPTANIPPAARMAAMATAKKMAGMHPDIGSGPMMGYEGTAGSGRAREPHEVEWRSCGVELRSDGDGRTLVGYAVPFGTTTTLGDGRRERFLPGAFAGQLANDQWRGQVKFYDSHSSRIDQKLPIARTMVLAEQPNGLYGEWHMHGTHAGDDALELVRTGEVTGLSIGFKPLATRRADDGTLERTNAHLDHVVLTAEPQYATAGVIAVRAVVTVQPLASFRGALLRAQSIRARMRA